MTVVSNGGGQESTYFIVRCLLDPAFRKKHIHGQWIVAFSDTGNEHPHTYDNLQRVLDLCVKHDVPCYNIHSGMGYHSDSWISLTHQYKKNRTIGSAAFKQTCTDNLKVKPIDRFVESWIKGMLSLGDEFKNKKAYYEFTKSYGKIRLILNFAKGEEGRTSNGNKFDPVWKKACVERYYPLIVDGIDRQACIDYFATIGWTVWPSNCMICFYQSDQEILWLYRNYPAVYYDWVDMEAAKLSKCADMEVVKNLGVYGKITLPEKLARAQEKYGHWSDEQLNEYKMSHGHCIKSKY